MEFRRKPYLRMLVLHHKLLPADDAPEAVHIFRYTKEEMEDMLLPVYPGIRTMTPAELTILAATCQKT